ncbi:MAG: hypothetical protein HQL46_02040 [Gammaproteobacteria bacterium]|nr:hypothetical protein [Gammaproteobacteria bacterium]
MSVLVVFMFFFLGYYVGEFPQFSEAPNWKQYTSLSMMGVGMLLWTSTLASRAYLVQKNRLIFIIGTWLPFVNIIFTLILGLQPATRPGYEEKPHMIEKALNFIILGSILLLILGALLGGVLSFFESELFETIKKVIGGTLAFIILYYISKSITSSSDSASSTTTSSSETDKPQRHSKKKVGFYRINIGGLAHIKIPVYSNGIEFTAYSNGKDITAKSFDDIGPLINTSYISHKGYADFQQIDAIKY